MLATILEAFSSNSPTHSGIHFEWPWLWWLAPLPLLIAWLPASYDWRAALQVPFYDSLTKLHAPLHLNARRLGRNLLLWVLWLLLVLSASRPIWVGDPIHLSTQGRDLMLAVDISGSMDAKDMRSGARWVRRISTVKTVLGNFIDRRTGDRLGLILFGAVPYLQAPLSFDLKTIHTLLLEAELGFAGQKTAIGDAVGLAIKRLHQRPTDSRVLILLTDGANNAGNIDPVQAARLAAEKDIRIYTIGIGADASPSGFFGRLRANRDLDEHTLMKIAEVTGGKYYRARDPVALNNIYKTLDELEPIQQEEELFRPRTDLYYIPLTAVLIASMLFATILLARQYFTRILS